MSLTTNATVVAAGLARDTVAADLGAYFVASTPTPGTGIIGHAINTTFVETKPLFYLYNGGANTIYPTYLRLTMTVLPVGNAMQQFTVSIDQARTATGGTALTVVNTNINSSVASGAQILVGAVTASEATAQRRILGNRMFRVVIGVVGDVYQFAFGSNALADPASLPTAGTLRTHVLMTSGPAVLTPGSSMLITAWGATFSTGATYEYELGFVER